MRTAKFIFNIIRNSCLIIVCGALVLFSYTDSESLMKYNNQEVWEERQANGEVFQANMAKLPKNNKRPIQSSDLFQTNKIPIYADGGLVMLDPASLVYAEISNRITTIYIQDQKAISIRRPLDAVEELLPTRNIFRIRNAIINLNHVQATQSVTSLDSYEKFVRMSNGDSIKISRTKANYLEEILEHAYTENK